MPNCDCAATPEELARGIHQTECAHFESPVDDPADHYQL